MCTQVYTHTQVKELEKYKAMLTGFNEHYEFYKSSYILYVYRLEKDYTALKSKENEEQIELRVCWSFCCCYLLLFFFCFLLFIF